MTSQLRKTQPFEFYSEFVNAEHAPTAFAWPGEMEFETAQPAKRKSPGTDCGRAGSPFINDTMSIMNTGYDRDIGEFRTRYFAHFGRAILGAFWGLKKYMIPVRHGGKVVANTVQGRIALLKRDIAGSPPYTADRRFNPMFMYIEIAKRA